MTVEVRRDPDAHRHVAVKDGRDVGFVVDHVHDELHLLVHTEVSDEVAGEGVGSSLVRQVLDGIRDDEDRVVPLCPFVRGWIERHPEYDDLVDHQRLRQLIGDG